MKRLNVFPMLLCAALLASAGSAAAQTPPQAARTPQNLPQPPEWDRLSPAQREAIIEVMRERWDSNPHERARMLQHAERWRQMSPEQRREARAAFEQGRGLPPAERSELREKLKAMTPDERREWLRAHRQQRERRP